MCTRAFQYQRSLSRHIAEDHRHIRYPCPVEGCPRTFRRKLEMRRHVEKHGTEIV